MTERLIADLCRRGGLACIDGDLTALGQIARELAEAMPEPLHCELVALGELCDRDPARAIAAWHRLREILTRDDGARA